MGIFTFYLYTFGASVILLSCISVLIMVVKETVMFDDNNMIIISQRFFGYKSKKVTPLSSIEYFFMHERFNTNKVQYYIGAKLKGSHDVRVLFEHCDTSLVLLEPVFRYVQFIFQKKKNSGT